MASVPDSLALPHVWNAKDIVRDINKLKIMY